MAQQDDAPERYEGSQWATLTPDDDADLPFRPIAIAVGATAGTIVAVDEAGNESTFYGLAGDVRVMRPVRIKATGTTATPLIGIKR